MKMTSTSTLATGSHMISKATGARRGNLWVSVCQNTGRSKDSGISSAGYLIYTCQSFRISADGVLRWGSAL